MRLSLEEAEARADAFARSQGLRVLRTKPSEPEELGTHHTLYDGRFAEAIDLGIFLEQHGLLQGGEYLD